VESVLQKPKPKWSYGLLNDQNWGFFSKAFISCNFFGFNFFFPIANDIEICRWATLHIEFII
jgi:hypothetical protein